MRLPLLMLLIVLVFSIVIDIIIRKDISDYTKGKKGSKIYLTTSVIFWLLLITITVYPKRDTSHSIQALMWFFLGYISIYISKTVYVIFSLLSRIPALWHAKRSKIVLWVGFCFSLITLFSICWGAFVTRKQLQVNEVEICSNNIPKEFNDYRLLQFSDLHVGTWGNDTVFVSKLVDEINSLKPDLIVFTGDVVNRQTSELEPFLKILSRLHAPDGVISVLGNHDYGDYINWKYPSEREENNILLAMWQKQMGWKLLNNEHLYIRRDNDSLAIVGVENWGEPPFKQYGSLNKALLEKYGVGRDTLPENIYKVLLSHNPEHWNREVSGTYDIDLTLSGHTHAMQFMLSAGDKKWSPAAWKYKNWGGLYEERYNGKPQFLYVNIGSGEVAMPFRIGAVPELTLFTLKNCNSDE